MITIKNLRVSTIQGKRILESLSFELKKANVLGVYGPNGSGKSTFLKAISGMPLPHVMEGAIYFDQWEMTESSSPIERVNKVLYLGSDFRTPFDLTVQDLLEMGAQVNLPAVWPELGSAERTKISKVVEALKLNPLLDRYFETLSDGEKQWVMFARGLIQSPAVLILDESFSKLDLDRLILVTRVIRSFASSGMTFLIASHDLNFLSEVSDQLILMKSGKSLGMGMVDEMLTSANLDDLYPEVSLQVVKSPETGKLKVLY